LKIDYIGSLKWGEKITTNGCFRLHTRVGTLIVATIYLQLIQNRYMFRSLNLVCFCAVRELNTDATRNVLDEYFVKFVLKKLQRKNRLYSRQKENA